MGSGEGSFLPADEPATAKPFSGPEKVPGGPGKVCDDDPLFPLYMEEDDEEVMHIDEEVEVEVAADTGAVAHVVRKGDLPRTVKPVIPKDGKLKHFVSASDDRITNYGLAEVELIQEDGTIIDSTFNVTDVCRPLHSISTICDTDKEVLFMKQGGVVVPEGTFSRLLAQIARDGKVLAKYWRKGGLYVAKMRVRDPKRRPKSTFGRPGQGQ